MATVYKSLQEIGEPEPRERESDEDLTYWATKGPDELPDLLRERRAGFLRFFKKTDLYTRICRSYRYYHGNFYSDSLSGDAIKIAGEEGEIRKISINAYRSAIKLLVSYIVAQKPEWNGVAKTSDFESIEAAKVTNSILDGYMDDPTYNLESCLGRAVEQSLVLTMGYLWDCWDPVAGEMLDAEEAVSVDEDGVESVQRLGEDRFEGEFDFRSPSVVDVVYDLSAGSFEKSNWVLVRACENKFDLAAQYEGDANDILALPSFDEEIEENQDEVTDPFDSLSYFGFKTEKVNSDSVWVYYFYHKPRPSMNRGRFVKFVEDIVLDDTECRHIPVSRMMPSEYLLTNFGYTQAFDCQGPQEALNGIASAVLTNQSALGSCKMWFRSGEPINLSDLEPGVSVIQTPTKPESLNFLQSAPELVQAIQMYTGFIDMVLGVAPASRGQVPPAARSAASLAMLDSRTLQQASDIIKNYRLFLCRVGSSIIQTLGEKADEVRLVSVLGEYGARYIGSFTKESLRGVKRVVVQSGNPMMSTLAGRTQMAEFLIQTGLIKTPEEMITVLKTGNLDRLTEHTEATVRSAQAENDAALRGEEIDTFALTDDHVYHAKKIVSLMDMPVVRRDQGLRERIQAHALQHAQALMDPAVQQFQVMMGYQLGAMAGAMGGGHPRGGGGGPGGGQSQDTGMPGGANPEVAQRVNEAAQNASLG